MSTYPTEPFCHYPSFSCCLFSSFILKLCSHVSHVDFQFLLPFLPSSVFPFLFLTCPFPNLIPPVPHPLVSGCVCFPSCLCQFVLSSSVLLPCPCHHQSLLKCLSLFPLGILLFSVHYVFTDLYLLLFALC